MRIDSTTEIVSDYNGWTGEELVKELGAAYVPGRDVKDIAKDVRAMVKKAVKENYLPKSLKVSVRINRYSLGCSLEITIKAIDDCILNVAAWRENAANHYNLSWADLGGRYNELGSRLIDTLELFGKAFQKSETHGQSDYHNSNFHLNVTVASDVRAEQVSKFVEVVE